MLPTHKGHLGMPYKDHEQQREADRRWRAANVEKVRETNRRWREVFEPWEKARKSEP